MEHDETCRQHDLALAGLAARFTTAEGDMAILVERMQRLVDQYHEQNVSIERLSGEIRHLIGESAAFRGAIKVDLVSQTEFLGLRKIVLWIVGVGSTIITGVVVALLTGKVR